MISYTTTSPQQRLKRIPILYNLPKSRQTLLHATLELQQLYGPESTAPLVEKGIAFASLNKLIIYLTDTVLRELGEEKTLDRGSPWFVPYSHPHIHAVRKDTDDTFHSWQVQENLDGILTTVSYSHIPDNKETLHIKVVLPEPQSAHTTTQILQLELMYPKNNNPHNLQRTVIIYRTDKADTDKREYLTDITENIPLSEPHASFWTRNPNQSLFD